MESKFCPPLTSSVSGRIDGRADSGVGDQKRSREAIRKTAQEFEALFVGMMLKSMRETAGPDAISGGGRGEDIYRSLLDQEYATAISANGGIGIAKLMENELLEHEYRTVRHEPRKESFSKAEKPEE